MIGPEEVGADILKVSESTCDGIDVEAKRKAIAISYAKTDRPKRASLDIVTTRTNMRYS